MTVLKIIGIILLCIVGLLLLPVLLTVIMSFFKTKFRFVWLPDKKEFTVSHLFLKLRLYPQQKRKPGKEKKRTEKKEPEQKKEPEEKSEPSFLSGKLKKLIFDDYLRMLGMLRHGLIRKLKFEKLYLKINIGSPSADVTATRYGQLTALVFPILGKLHALGRLKDADVSIYPDFTSAGISVKADIVVSLRPVHALTWAVKAAFIILKK